MTSYFIQAFIYLVAAVALVPLAKRLGLGSVLGYLIAGVIIGPALGLVAEEAASSVQHFAEFGVVMMLFLIGMELQPAALWGIRHRLFGLGGLQVILTTLAMASVGYYLLGQSWQMSLVVGMILSLSSTAIVLQTLAEKNLSRGEGGGSAFSVLLFQDIAVIPMLALIPFLALPETADLATQAASDAEHADLSLVAHLPAWGKTLAMLASIGLLVLGGRYLVRPLFHYVAESDSREVFTATALLLMVGVSALMSLVGLSPALGAFLAGVLLASSEFRHELESDLEPFKGLLLGLFFMTVGAGVDFALLWEKLGTILLLTLSLMLLKCVLLWLLAWLFRLPRSDRWLFAFSLAQAGEFGFVLLTYATNHQALTSEDAQLLALVVALSMFLTPGLFILLERVIFPRLAEKPATHHQEDIDKGPVIIAGVGRFGQVVNRLLVSNGFQTVLLDHKASQIELMRRINVKGYFGDATRPDMLETAGIGEASLLIIAMDERKSAIKLVHHVKRHYPHVHVIARAFDRRHLYELRDAGADFCISETYYSALEMGAEALRKLGYADIVAEQRKQAFNDTEASFRDKLYTSWRDKGEGRGIDDHYRGVVIRLQEALYETMQNAEHEDMVLEKSNDSHDPAESSPPQK
ncbi:MAG: monovalent cation:proton antiporter-2 (CPA2) family protein [Oceanobacter sp.]